jgi:hypothetical protein
MAEAFDGQILRFAGTIFPRSEQKSTTWALSAHRPLDLPVARVRS